MLCRRFLVIWILFSALCTSVTATVSDEPEYYTVQEGDCLINIADRYGDWYNWVYIFEANSDQIQDPDLILPDQRLLIPDHIVNRSETVTRADTLKNPEGEGDLEAFRNAFETYMASRSGYDENYPSTDPHIVHIGLVIDETQSKIGRDFYDIFYRNWTAPEGKNDYVITISEQPLPSLGTIVSIEINDVVVYRNRLQPRYEVIMDMARQAVAVSYHWLFQQVDYQKNWAF